MEETMEMPQEKVTFRLGTARFENHLVNGLNALMISNRLLDCTLIAENKTVHVHSVVLSALSPFFQKLFDQQTHVQHPTFFFDTSVTFKNLLRLVNYLYAGEIELPIEEAEELRKILKQYQFPEVAILENHDVQFSEDLSAMDYISSLPAIGKTLTKTAKSEMIASKIVNIQQQDDGPSNSQFDVKTTKVKPETNASKIMNILQQEVGPSNSQLDVKTRKSKLIQELLSTSLPVSFNSIQCVHCLKFYANKNNRLKHEKLCKENPEAILQPCPKCNNKYSTVAILLRHLKTAHKEESSF